MNKMKIETLGDLSNLLKEPEPKPKAEVADNIPWHYLVEYVLEVFSKDEYPEECERVEVYDHSYITIRGDYDSDMYYSECVCNADPHDYLPTAFTGHFELDEWESGVYRMVYGVKCGGEKYWTDCGYEYDAWEDYDLISKYHCTDKEAAFVREGFADDMIPFEDGQQ